MIKLFFILSFLNAILFANVDDMDKAFSSASKYYNIDERILHTFSLVESNKNRYAMNVLLEKRDVFCNALKGKKIVCKKDGAKRALVFPKTKKESDLAFEYITKYQDVFGVKDYDLGIMQINRLNFEKYGVNKKEYYQDYVRNIFLGAKIARECFDHFKNESYGIIYAIECYNKGYNKKTIKKGKFNYYKNFLENYYKVALK